MRYSAGQSVTEYTVIFGLVVIGAVVALGPLGNTLSGLFTQSNNTLAPGMTQMVSLLQAPAANGPGTAAPEVTATTLPGGSSTLSNVTIDLGNGKSLTFEYREPSALVEPAGGNGEVVTLYQTDLLRQLAQQLLDADAISETEFQDLAELAMRGDRIGRIQAAIEGAAPPGGYGYAFDELGYTPLNETIVLDGKAMTVRDAFTELGFYNPNTPPSADGVYSVNGEMLNGIEYQRQQVNNLYKHYLSIATAEGASRPSGSASGDFLMQLKVVQESSAFENPAIQGLVEEYLAKNIFLSAHMTSSWRDTNRGETYFSDVTDTNARGICDLSNTTQCKNSTDG